MFLSIIVPVYNTEKYLEECLNSLIQQNIPENEYEMIFINDGSTDSSLEILEKYPFEHQNIQIIDQENQGISAARNKGIQLASGKYIWFVDSDDFIQKNILKDVREVLEKTRADKLIVGRYAFKNNLEDREKVLYEKGKVPINQYAEEVYVTSTLIKRKFLVKNNLCFNSELFISEDVIFNLNCNRNSPKIYRLMNNACYFYRMNSGSISVNKTPELFEKKIDGSIKAAVIARDIEQSTHSSDAANAMMSNIWQALYMILQINDKKANEKISIMRNEKIYPCKRPKTCTLSRSYVIDNKTFKGKVFDFVYLHMNLVWGFSLMRVLRTFMKTK